MDTTPEQATALAAAIAVMSTVPQLKSLTDAHRPAFERRLWPDGAPATVTWTLLRERLIDAVEESAASLVARDIDLAERSGHPWPGGASIRRETAVRVGLTESLVERARSIHPTSTLDIMLFGEAGPSEPVSFVDLYTTSAAVMLNLSRRILERDPAIEPAHTGRVLVRMYGEWLAALRSLLAMVGDKEAEAIVAKLLKSLDDLRPGAETPA